MVKILKTYQITAIIEAVIGVDIKAEDFEDAIEKSKSLKVTDFVKPLGDYLDSNMKIQGVYDNQIGMKTDR